MRTVALIPIKLGSRRIPQKNIKPFFDGTPLMSFIQQTCLESELIDEVYIYCSDEAVMPYVLPGVKFIKRPQELDADDKNANDIIRAFMKEVDADIYVNAHTTSPFAKVATIDRCITMVVSGNYDSAFCAENIKAFMWMDGNPINFDPDHFPRTQDLPDIFVETSIAYVFTKESFLKHKRRLGARPYVCEVGKIEAMDIDYPEDFALCDAIYRMRKEKK
ncbi:MAG: acylneuraminate cytidylyltransferase family protein [Bacteroidales bacterium]|jgi:CMP-N-acetylneuraminic acid synthetase|nr:acylneuraminate cytidylyltransferase family protein [Bacteroidales bacterium]